jgi:hypothetical protein
MRSGELEEGGPGDIDGRPGGVQKFDHDLPRVGDDRGPHVDPGPEVGAPGERDQHLSQVAWSRLTACATQPAAATVEPKL